MDFKIHWGGGLRTATTVYVAGYPCCCASRKAEIIKEKGSLTTNPEEVTCKKCAKMVRRLLKKGKNKDA